MSEVRGTFLSCFNEAALDDCEDNSFTHLTAIDSNRDELSQIGIFRLTLMHIRMFWFGFMWADVSIQTPRKAKNIKINFFKNKIMLFIDETVFGYAKK